MEIALFTFRFCGSWDDQIKYLDSATTPNGLFGPKSLIFFDFKQSLVLFGPKSRRFSRPGAELNFFEVYRAKFFAQGRPDHIVRIKNRLVRVYLSNYVLQLSQIVKQVSKYFPKVANEGAIDEVQLNAAQVIVFTA